MKKEKKTFFAFSAIAFVIILLGVYLYFSQRISMNPEGTVGNTAGNLNNSGLFCEYDGRVYFSNAYDGGSLYVMNPDESGMKRLNTLKVRNILAGGDYLYYFQTGSSSDSGPGQLRGMKSFDRCKLNGSGASTLTQDTVVTGQLVNNYLYLMTAPNSGPVFYKLKIDRTDKVVLADYNINPACAENGVIYYNGTVRDHYLYALNTDTDVADELWRGNIWYPVLQGDYIYYLDVANDYRLCRYSLSLNVIEALTNDRVDCFNVGGGFIYYQKNGGAKSAAQPGAAQLKCMRTDGSDVRVIAEGNYTNINMTSQYVYFQTFGDDTVMYHSAIGSNFYESFEAAAQGSSM